MYEDKNGIYLQEFKNLRLEIISLKKDVNRAFERSGHFHMNSQLMEMKVDFSRPIIHYMLEDIKNTFDDNLNLECDKKEVCKPAFSNLLQELALLLMEDKLTEDSLVLFQERFDELKGFLVADKCDNCVKSAARIFDKQMEMIRSFNRSLNDSPNSKSGIDINSMSDDIVTEICEPLANKQRLAILKSLNSDTKSFSELSKITGLRGGNLLFHIQKLLDTEMIIQITERGDYVITKKGHLTLKGMAELYDRLNNQQILI
ncbi:winged helix-turn-helix domain-containing protein [Methanolobus psychrotolerans]|uniref:winged helix-turn-helix domain-containing protein n=1 Tax=Methanolobus psychrotolerans TaxID=1874706 RepID=UPI000B917C6F|nr:winged helix-turn-helix domain-containing protein [Methanolobus psychrotolerans]